MNIGNAFLPVSVILTAIIIIVINTFIMKTNFSVQLNK